MNSTFKVTLFAAGILAAAHGKAQTHTDTTNFGHKVGKTAKTVGHETAKTAKTVGHETAKTATAVGNKTAEIAAKGAAAVTDPRYEGKMGPGGETVYITHSSQYFYVNKKGGRVYLTKSQLRDKPSK